MVTKKEKILLILFSFLMCKRQIFYTDVKNFYSVKLIFENFKVSLKSL
jgi:hypothetical protein